MKIVWRRRSFFFSFGLGGGDVAWRGGFSGEEECCGGRGGGLSLIRPRLCRRPPSLDRARKDTNTHAHLHRDTDTNRQTDATQHTHTHTRAGRPLSPARAFPRFPRPTRPQSDDLFPETLNETTPPSPVTNWIAPMDPLSLEFLFKKLTKKGTEEARSRRWRRGGRERGIKDERGWRQDCSLLAAPRTHPSQSRNPITTHESNPPP
jgi:hypothetical protein